MAVVVGVTEVVWHPAQTVPAAAADPRGGYFRVDVVAMRMRGGMGFESIRVSIIETLSK